ncbi:hypothetical protein KEM55_003578 [Ascosphaera atra]|nr:hypothetical protein KEM55_003578 [Ascosphaera atra]
MEDEVARLRHLVAEAQDRYKEEQRLREEEQRRREEEQRRPEEVEERLKEAERKLSNTTFYEYLQVCHERIFVKRTFERNRHRTTTAGLTQVDGKFFPHQLKPWANFTQLHDEAYAELERTFQRERLFPSVASLGWVMQRVGERKLASEYDLREFEHLAVEGCVEDLVGAQACHAD